MRSLARSMSKVPAIWLPSRKPFSAISRSSPATVFSSVNAPSTPGSPGTARRSGACVPRAYNRSPGCRRPWHRPAPGGRTGPRTASRGCRPGAPRSRRAAAATRSGTRPRIVPQRMVGVQHDPVHAVVAAGQQILVPHARVISHAPNVPRASPAVGRTAPKGPPILSERSESRDRRSPLGSRLLRSRLSRAGGSHSLEDRGDALAAADAHGDERVPAGGPPQLIQRLDDEDGTSGTDRVPKRDPAAVWVGLIQRQAEFADD